MKSHICRQQVFRTTRKYAEQASLCVETNAILHAILAPGIRYNPKKNHCEEWKTGVRSVGLRIERVLLYRITRARGTRFTSEPKCNMRRRPCRSGQLPQATTDVVSVRLVVRDSTWIAMIGRTVLARFWRRARRFWRGRPGQPSLPSQATNRVRTYVVV